MADYRQSPWRPYYSSKDPIERCRRTARNYRPFSRYSPYVDPRFYSSCYHRNAMPHQHDPRYARHGVHHPPSLSGYSGWTVPMESYFKWEN